MNMHSWLAEGSSWLWPNVAVHLWETTLLVGLVALGVRLLKRAPAGTRYWFWLLAAVKLLVPSVFRTKSPQQDFGVFGDPRFCCQKEPQAA